MFGRKKQQKLEDISSNIATLIEMSFWSIRCAHKGELPAAIEKDEFVLGYIHGVASSGAFAAGMGKSADRRLITTNVFEHLFPGKGQEVAKRCTELSGTEQWDTTNELGVEESVPVFKAMLAGNLEPADSLGVLKKFDAYLDKNYMTDTNGDDAE